MIEERIAFFSESGSEARNMNKATMYIALIDKDFVNDPNAIVECLIARKKGKPMFAIVHGNITIPKAIRKIKWDAITVCSEKIDIKTNGMELARHLNILEKKYMEKHGKTEGSS